MRLVLLESDHWYIPVALELASVTLLVLFYCCELGGDGGRS